MRNVILALFGMLFFAVAAEAHWPWQTHAHPHNYRYNPPRVYYQPYIIWLPQGINLNVNSVHVDPYRRNVTMGINFGFSHIPEVQTFNFSNGWTGR